MKEIDSGLESLQHEVGGYIEAIYPYEDPIGAEPKDCEVQEYIQKWYFSLKFSPVVETVVKDIKRNPKRMQREAKKQMLEIGIGTKSQQALKLQQEQNKQERKEKSRKRKEAEEQRMFELKQRKKLEENAKK